MPLVKLFSIYWRGSAPANPTDGFAHAAPTAVQPTGDRAGSAPLEGAAAVRGVHWAFRTGSPLAVAAASPGALTRPARCPRPARSHRRPDRCWPGSRRSAGSARTAGTAPASSAGTSAAPTMISAMPMNEPVPCRRAGWRGRRRTGRPGPRRRRRARCRRRPRDADDQQSLLALPGCSAQLHVRDLGPELLDTCVVLIHGVFTHPDRQRTIPLRSPSGSPTRRIWPLHHDRSHVGDAEHGTGELLDDQDRHARSSDLGDDAVELLDHQRREAHRQLVEQQHGRVDGQAAGHGQHLLLAARQGPGQLAAAFLQAGEPLVGDGLDL